MPEHDAETTRALEALSPTVLHALARALERLADRQDEQSTRLLAHLDADRRAVEARALAWTAIASFAGSYPGKGLLVMLGCVLVAALARAFGLDTDYLQAVAGVINH